MEEGAVEVRYSELSPAPRPPQTIRFYYRADDQERLLGETMLFNDGVTPDKRNVQFHRTADGVPYVTLRGKMQRPQHWRIDAKDGDVSMEWFWPDSP